MAHLIRLGSPPSTEFSSSSSFPLPFSSSLTLTRDVRYRPRIEVIWISANRFEMVLLSTMASMRVKRLNAVAARIEKIRLVSPIGFTQKLRDLKLGRGVVGSHIRCKMAVEHERNTALSSHHISAETLKSGTCFKNWNLTPQTMEGAAETL